MKRRLHLQIALSPLLVAGALLMSGCMDDNYDTGDIDLTMGFGADSLTLPLSSTAEIPLADVLDIEDGGCVVVDSLQELGGEAWDYWFYQAGDDVEPTHPRVEKFLVHEKNIVKYDSIGMGSSLAGKSRTSRRVSAAMTAEANIHLFDYEGDKPAEVISIDEATVESHLSLSMDPAEVAPYCAAFETVTLEFPAYMTLTKIGNVSKTVGGYTMENNKVVFRDVKTSGKLEFEADVTRFDFKCTDTAYGALTIAGDKVTATGKLHVEIYAPEVEVSADLANKFIKSTIDMEDFTVTGGTGYFTPSIELSDMGGATVTGVPDFLTEEDVVVDLYNPQILLNINNDMDVDGTIDGTLVSKKGGATLATIPVEGLQIKRNGMTKICICRTDEGVDASEYDQVKVVPELSDAVKTIPDRIEFSATATADGTKKSSFLLGHDYTVTTSYDFRSPLAFAADARFVYRDTLDDWHSDIEDMEFADESDAILTLTGNVENRIPAYLTVSVVAIDEAGNPIPDDVAVTVMVDGQVDGRVKASADGSTAATSVLAIELKQMKEGGLNKLDGILFQATGTASDDSDAVVGKTLNAKNHTLKIDNIKVTVTGQIIEDFN